MKIDERRWKAADLDHDDKLSDEEFGPFYQPWEYDYMQGIVAQENLEDLDKDRDGRLSPQEFLGTRSSQGYFPLAYLLRCNWHWLQWHIRELTLVLNQVLLFSVPLGIQNTRELPLE